MSAEREMSVQHKQVTWETEPPLHAMDLGPLDMLELDPKYTFSII